MFWGRHAPYSALFVAFLFVLASCADPPMQLSPLLSPTPSAATIYLLQARVEGKPFGGNSRTLKQGSSWTEFGTTAEGVIYRPHDTVLTVENINVREAYIVVHDGIWVGFWLPVEKAFVPVAKPTGVQLQRKE
jgi:hypothetical protein